MKFLIFRIAVHLNDFHTIQQRSWYSLRGICCCNKEHFRQIQWNLYIVVPESDILFSIQYLQQSGKGISFVIIAHLINLIKKHQRIFDTRLLESGCNPPRHGSHIGFPVTSYLCFIPNPSEAYPHILFIKRLGNTSGNGSLPGSRRSHQTDDRAFPLAGQLAHCQKFKNTLLDLLQPVVLPLQNLLSALHALVIHRCLIPGELQKCLNVSPLHGTFRAAARKRFEPGNFLSDFCLYFFGCLQLSQALFKLIRIRKGIFISQLFLDIPELLPQKILLLIFLNTPFQLLGDILPRLGNFNFTLKMLTHQLIALLQIQSFQYLLFFLKIHGQICCNLVDQPPETFHTCISMQRILIKLRIMGGKNCKQFLDLSEHCFLSDLFFHRGLLFLHPQNKCFYIFFILFLYFLQDSAAFSFHQNPDNLIRQLRDLLYLRNRSNRIQMFLPRHIHIRILLCRQKKDATAHHGAFQRLYRSISV